VAGEEVSVAEYRGDTLLSKWGFFVRACARAVSKRPDLIWCSHINLGRIGLFLSRFTGTEYVVAVYGIDANDLTAREKRILMHAKKVVVASEFTRQILLRQVPLLESTTDVLHPTVWNEERFGVSPKPKELEQELGLTGKKVLLTIARMRAEERYKGHDKLIELLPEILSKMPTAHYLIVGEGNDRPRLEEKVKKLGLERNISFVGRVDDDALASYYALADVFTMPSSQEGFGIVFLEAALSGKPIVAERAGGATEALAGGVLGTLIESNDLEGLQKALLVALQNPLPDEERQLLRATARSRYGTPVFQERVKSILARDSGFRVCYFGSYDPAYPRAKMCIDGLRLNGVAVRECRSDRKSKVGRLMELAFRYFAMWREIDVILVSEAGQAYVPLAKMLGVLTARPVALDAFISYYNVKTGEGSLPRNSLRARYYYWLDRLACMLADVVFLDTPAHAEFFRNTFGIPAKKLHAVPVGSDDSLFYPRETTRATDDIFTVFNISSFYPLHGIDCILEAANLLREESIRFDLYGDGPLFPAMQSKKEALGLPNVSFLGKIDIRALPEVMAGADICLGQFGGTEQADMVVPTKVFDALAMAKPIVTAHGRAIDSYLKDRENALLVPPRDPGALSRAILALKKDAALRKKIARDGYELYRSSGTPAHIGEILKQELLKLKKHG
jgi:glycosyltransferase involved in cell wall biosynthesis